MTRHNTIYMTAALLAAVLIMQGGPAVQAAQTSTAEVLQPLTDYSSYAHPAEDQNGCLYLTDNHTIEDVSSTTVSIRHFTFQIPGAWKDHIVIKTQYLNQTKDTELYKSPIRDSYIIRFYEKQTWEAYHSDSNLNAEDSSATGELAELRILSTADNDLSKWEDHPQYLHFGSVSDQKGICYELYLKRPKSSEKRMNEQYAQSYCYLSDINYEGRLISSFACEDDLILSYPTSYIKYHYVDLFDEASEGMAEGSTMPEDYTVHLPAAEKNQTDTMPSVLNQIQSSASQEGYKWTSFSSPWPYRDHIFEEQQETLSTPSLTPTPIEEEPTSSPAESVSTLPDPSSVLSEPQTTNPPASDASQAEPETPSGGEGEAS